MQENMDVRTSLAFHKNAVSVVDITALMSSEGMPLALARGNNHVLVLFSEPCCGHDGSRAFPEVGSSGPIQPLFNTSEHTITVAGCRLQTRNGTADALTSRLPVANNLSLTYGQIIGLGGDFYGDPNQPVCTASDPVGQFKANFVQLQSSAAQVNKILQIAYQYEFQPIRDRVRNGQPPSGVYAGIPTTKGWVMNDEDEDFDEATGGGGPGSPIFGRYSQLAVTNLDHFGADAMTCYRAGHTAAQQAAVQASKGANPDHDLLVAYAINAFADHFLTDLFAAGHMRTPRRKIYEYKSNIGVQLDSVSAGICAKAMHDEDNKFGLWVENKRGDRWVAYGDARYRDSQNAANRAIMKKALQQSMDDIWNAFHTGNIISDPTGTVFQYLPKIIWEIGQPSPGNGQPSPALQHRNDPWNWAPLFWFNPDDGYIYQRGSLTDISNRSFDWKSMSGLGIVGGTAGDLKILAGQGKIPYMPAQQYRTWGYSYPPNEAGPSGEIGWPALGPTWVRSVTGQDLRSLDWRIDGATGPTALP